MQGLGIARPAALPLEKREAFAVVLQKSREAFLFTSDESRQPSSPGPNITCVRTLWPRTIESALDDDATRNWPVRAVGKPNRASSAIAVFQTPSSEQGLGLLPLSRSDMPVQRPREKSGQPSGVEASAGNTTSMQNVADGAQSCVANLSFSLRAVQLLASRHHHSVLFSSRGSQPFCSPAPDGQDPEQPTYVRAWCRERRDTERGQPPRSRTVRRPYDRVRHTLPYNASTRRRQPGLALRVGSEAPADGLAVACSMEPSSRQLLLSLKLVTAPVVVFYLLARHLYRTDGSASQA